MRPVVRRFGHKVRLDLLGRRLDISPSMAVAVAMELYEAAKAATTAASVMDETARELRAKWEDDGL